MGTLRKGNGTLTSGVPFVAIHPHCIGRRPSAGPQGKDYIDDGSAYTHDARGVAQAVAYNWQSGGDVRLSFGKPNLQANQVPAVGVRRLTPTECERLQGFPDGHTAVDGMSDSARYRMLGNAVCVPVAEWIGRRIIAAG